MKIRTGFVSNSSSSSFCIFGTAISDLDIPDELRTELENAWALDELEIVRGISDYSGEVIIGLSPNSINDNETGLQFKQSVVDKINKACNTSITVDDAYWITDGGWPE